MRYACIIVSLEKAKQSKTVDTVDNTEKNKEDVRRLCANTTSFYKRLEHPWILVSAGVLEPIPVDTEGCL